MKTVGSLFSGYGGLDLGVQKALGPMRTAWVSDIEKGPQAILAERFPDAPNLGDITEVDWADVEPVDVLTGGSPCQDLSAAGQRRGMKPGTRSGLWESMTHAIEQLRPRLVVWENVLGALSADAFSLSDLEPGARPVGDESGRPFLRALGRVLGDLTNLGYDAAWATVRASDVGAPHNRARVFVVAYPDSGGFHGRREPASRASKEYPGASGDGHLLPTPCAQPSGNSPEDHLRKKPGREVVTDLAILVENDLLKTGGRLLPTPTAVTRDQTHEEVQSRFGPGGSRVSRGPNLDDLIHLLPTPNTMDMLPRRSDEALARAKLKGGCSNLKDVEPIRNPSDEWGEYRPAVERWERILGRAAPAPTQPSKTGKPQLNPAFVEWMMGLPQGWVTNVDISRAQQLRALGNGVVPQQAAAALTEIMSWNDQNGEAA